MSSSVRRLPRQAVRVVRRGVSGDASRLNLVAVSAIAIGAILIALQAALSGLWLLAAGVLLVGVGWAITAVKANKGAIFAARAERSLRQGVRTVGAVSPRAASGRGRPVSERQSRLDAIGVVRPEVINTSAKGRQAAAVKDDPQRPFRLYAATLGLQDRPESATEGTGRRIAVVGTASLVERLSTDYAVTRLHPGLSRAEFEASRPSALVIEEDGLRTGSWFGTLHAGGVKLMQELDALIEASRERGIMVYAVASDSLELSTTTLRERVSLVIHPDEPTSATGGADLGDAQQPLIDSLRRRPAQQSAHRLQETAS